MTGILYWRATFMIVAFTYFALSVASILGRDSDPTVSHYSSDSHPAIPRQFDTQRNQTTTIHSEQLHFQLEQTEGVQNKNTLKSDQLNVYDDSNRKENADEDEDEERDLKYMSFKDFYVNSKYDQIKKGSVRLMEQMCRPQGKKTLCYSHGSAKCFCSGNFADCSGKQFAPNMPYAPKLPKEIECLNFAYNNAKYLTESYFANVSSFIYIDFSFNMLETISEKTFERFSNLQYLILNHNVVSYKNLKRVLAFPPKIRLDIMDNGLRQLPEDYFNKFQDIPTSELYMDFNFIQDLDLSEFVNLHHLHYLSLTNVSIQKIELTVPLPSLTILDLDFNYISDFIVTCWKNATGAINSSSMTLIRDEHFGKKGPSLSLFPKISEIYLGVNNISKLPPYNEICLPSVRLLHLLSNNIKEIPENSFSSFTSLRKLVFDKQVSGITKVGPSAFSAPQLTTLYLSKNKINFGSADISVDMFNGTISLEEVSADHNDFGAASDNILIALFGHLRNLRRLNLGSGKMDNIPVAALAQLQKLETLFLYINNIKDIPPAAFDSMQSLQYLYLDENKISTVESSSFSDQTMSRLRGIDLSKNDFLCNCDLLWFQSWLTEAGPTLFYDYNSYRCADKPSMAVQDFSLSKQACLFSRKSYILFVVCLSIFILVFMVFAIVYRYRWNIRLMLYERRATPATAIEAHPQGVFRYDLFIVYCNDDDAWVEECLLPIIENKWGLKVCIHGRDFVAGGFIIDNIVESMNNSRRIMVVVSSRFALSKWCNFELQLCQSHVITHDLPSLFVIKLDDIEPRDMRASMYALYNTTCFLEWPFDQQELPRFWSRLEASLGSLRQARLVNVQDA